MKTELSIDVSRLKIIPEQNLEDRIGHVARIEFVSPKDEKDYLFKGDVRVGIQNKTDILQGHSNLILSHEDFQEFLRGYDVAQPEYLVGKPVISIYTRDRGVALCGLAPFNLDK